MAKHFRNVAEVFLDDFVTKWVNDGDGKILVLTARGGSFRLAVTPRELKKLADQVKDPLSWRRARLKIALYVPKKAVARLARARDGGGKPVDKVLGGA